MFENKTVIIGVTGGIAAYKIAGLTSMLAKTKADVHVIMTSNACNFINPITFETLTGNKCIVDTFDRNFKHSVEHIALAKAADIFMVAPATANTISKLAHGMADDMLTTTFLASTCQKLVVPAMNTGMYENQITQDNIESLEKYGIEVIRPDSGFLACGDIGSGKMSDPETLFAYIEKEIAKSKDMCGKKVMITAGATCEEMDPVRFITNHSSGKMGFALAKEAMLRGAKVTLIKAATTAAVPNFIEVIPVTSASDMFEEVSKRSKDMDIIIKAAAVSDYTPKEVANEKMKKKDGELTIELKRTPDILKYLGEHRKKGQFLCGFSMETENMLENSKMKLEKKNVDMIVANNLKEKGSGFGTDTNAVTLITRGDVKKFTLMSKSQVAEIILDEILTI